VAAEYERTSSVSENAHTDKGASLKSAKGLSP
jgi:hypothetical protein